MNEPEGLKRLAAARALEEVRSGMKLGLGTGSTVAHFLELLGGALRDGTLRDVVGIPSSVRTERRAAALGIPLSRLGEQRRLDLTVDGADEVSPELDLIKGMGGALLREKMLVQASEHFLVIADDRKSVAKLGTLSPLPVEVVDWGWEAHAAWLADRGARVDVLRTEGGEPFLSDNGNLMLVCRFPEGIEDAEGLHAGLKARAGVVETGLFLGMADRAILSGRDGIRVEMRRT